MSDSFPILSVDDLPRAVAFYSRLGFAESYRFSEEGAAAFVALERHGCEIGLAARHESGHGAFSYWVYVDDVDATHAELTAAGAPSEAEPRTEPWGERVASVRDPDGNVVHLGRAAAPDA
jgi:uncharacterized glyoxalase superfamily protein PhnB